MRSNEDLPSRESMKRAHRIRRFRRGNDEHTGRAYLGRRAKPWKTPNNDIRSAAA